MTVFQRPVDLPAPRRPRRGRGGGKLVVLAMILLVALPMLLLVTR